MAIATLSTIKTAIGLGARPNLFRIYFDTGSMGTDGGKDKSISLLCKAGSLPGSTLGVIEVPMGGGRRYKLAGDRTYAEWTVTVMNDATGNVRKAFEDYQKKFVATDFDVAVANFANRATTRATVTVEQLTEDASTIGRKYELVNCFPTDISAMDLSYDTTDTLQEFTVTWVYDYFKATS